MIAIIFEVEPAPGRGGDYLATAGALKPLLETIDGFISVERFQSLTNPGKILSVSFFAMKRPSPHGGTRRRTVARRPLAGAEFSATTACALLLCYATTGFKTGIRPRKTAGEPTIEVCPDGWTTRV